MATLVSPLLSESLIVLAAVAVGMSLLATLVYLLDVKWAWHMRNGQSILRVLAISLASREGMRIIKELCLLVIAISSFNFTQDGVPFSTLIYWSNVNVILALIVLLVFIISTVADLAVRLYIQKQPVH